MYKPVKYPDNNNNNNSKHKLKMISGGLQLLDTFILLFLQELRQDTSASWFINTRSCVLSENLVSSVGIATGYGLEVQGFGLEIFLFSKASRPVLGPTQPMGNGDFSPGVKGLWREADHSPPSSVEVKNTRRYTSTTSTSSWCGA
jgi:hypothetical protein